MVDLRTTSASDATPRKPDALPSERVPDTADPVESDSESSAQARPLWTPDPNTSTSTAAFLAFLNGRVAEQQPHQEVLQTYEDLWRRSCTRPAEFWGAVWDFVGIVGERGVNASAGAGVGGRKRKRDGKDADDKSTRDRDKAKDALNEMNETQTEDTDGGFDAAHEVVDERATPADNPRWFPHARLNWAENMLPPRVRTGAAGARTALVQVVEPLASTTFDPATSLRRVSYAELYALVADLASALLELGLKPGDRVGAYCSNCIENVAACLATTAIGCIWVSAAADFGPEGVLERFEQVRPKVVFSVNGVVYNGKLHPHLPKLGALLDGMAARGCAPSKVVVVDALSAFGLDAGAAAGAGGWRADWAPWSEFAQRGAEAKLGRDAQGELLWARLDFNWPLWILFSSGTTGKPKPIVHRAGGMLLQARKEFAICADLRPEDVFFYYTTTGWMMWNFLVAGLASGCTLVLYDGSPLREPALLWTLVDVLGITIFGTSAKYLDQLSKVYKPREHHDLSTLKQIYSTGSPLAPASYDYVYAHIHPNVLLGSITGGTDICSLFAGMNTALPVYRGEIQCRMLGMAVEVFAPDGTARAPGQGKSGELVCTRPFPCQPLGFWPLAGFPDIGEAEEVEAARSRHQASYFGAFKDVWYHGDHVLLTPSRRGNGGGLVMLGRSDGVLNPGGVRFGSAEIYDVVEHCFKPGGDAGLVRDHVVVDCLAVGQAVAGGADERVVLFVQLEAGCALNEAVQGRLRAEIRKRRTARHVPEKIVQVTDIPYTLNGKRVEVPIKKIINGAPVGEVNRATLRNPECLEEYAVLGEQLRAEVQ